MWSLISMFVYIVAYLLLTFISIICTKLLMSIHELNIWQNVIKRWPIYFDYHSYVIRLPDAGVEAVPSQQRYLTSINWLYMLISNGNPTRPFDRRLRWLIPLVLIISMGGSTTNDIYTNLISVQRISGIRSSWLKLVAFYHTPRERNPMLRNWCYNLCSRTELNCEKISYISSEAVTPDLIRCDAYLFLSHLRK